MCHCTWLLTLLLENEEYEWESVSFMLNAVVHAEHPVGTQFFVPEDRNVFHYGFRFFHFNLCIHFHTACRTCLAQLLGSSVKPGTSGTNSIQVLSFGFDSTHIDQSFGACPQTDPVLEEGISGQRASW